MTNTFYKGAAGIIVAFSITDIQSFQNVSTWVKQINNSAEEKVVKLLVGTKSDLESERKVTLAEA
jgi:Ras-related protein Rab-1A